MQLTCPRCRAFVPSAWPTCKICGYDPDRGRPFEATVTYGAPRPRSRLTDVVGGLFTLALLLAIAFGTVKGGLYLWNHRDGPVERQEFVAIPR